MNLKDIGWNDQWGQIFQTFLNMDPEYSAGRVVLEHKHMYRVYSEHGELLAEVSGKMKHIATGREHYPAVGDWVVMKARPEEGRATVHGILPRTSKFSRKIAGSTTEEQIVAANVDTVFLVNALNQDFNLRRLERYLILAWESGANPVIVLSKADLCDDVEAKIAEVESVAFGVPIHAISSQERQGLEQLEPYLRTGQTVALLGSSGSGKSTLINTMLGKQVQEVLAVREGDDRGRHTTTYRELFLLPKGGLMIDTPGMRELQLWHADEGFQDAFDDIEQLGQMCYFSDCKHRNEPRCAVREAIDNGTLDRSRYDSYLKLKRELAYLEAKDNQKAKQQAKSQQKKGAMVTRYDD